MPQRSRSSRPRDRKSKYCTVVSVEQQVLSPEDVGKDVGTTAWSTFPPVARKWIKIFPQNYPFNVHCMMCDTPLLEKGCGRDLEPARGSQAIWALLPNGASHHFSICSMKAVEGLNVADMQDREALCEELAEYLAAYRRPDPFHFGDYRTELKVPDQLQENTGRRSSGRLSKHSSSTVSAM